MLKNERYALILNRLKENNSILIEELEQELDVSNETIRRDLIQLEMQGLLRRVHGGAVINNTTINELGYEERKHIQIKEKMAISAKAARMVKEGEAILVLASTTTQYMGPLLAKKNNITIVTDSIELAYQAAQNETNRVILTGGEMVLTKNKVMGEDTKFTLSNHRVDKVFFSATAVAVEHGITEYSEEEAAISRLAINVGKTAILLMDSSKFDDLAFCKIAEASDVDEIITDWKAPADIVKRFNEAGILCTKAEKL